jgi:hypothetical protein
MSKRLGSTPLLILTVAYFVLLMGGGSQMRIAFQTPLDASAANYVAANAMAIKFASFLELVSALVLGTFMALSIGRVRQAVGNAHVRIATLGSIATTVMLALSALATWSLTRPGVASAQGAVSVLQSLAFDGGGPGFAVFLGLFVAGVSMAAGQGGLIPRWLMWFGIGVASACELASLTLLNFTAGYFIPAGRFGSIVWMIFISLKLQASTTNEPAVETDYGPMRRVSGS